MSATVLSFFRPASTTSGDWSQQELAEFYRVEAASLQAGLRLSLERGLSDEGDPWLVFCREDGDVFLHFARIDGSYVICSDMIEAPLVGPDFRALLAELVQQNPSVLPLPRSGPNGEGARRGAQIVMHPAALLAAIVATACLFSTMNEAVAGELDVGPAHPAGLAPDHADASTVAGHAAPELASEHDRPVDRSHDGHDREFALLTGVILACITAFEGGKEALATAMPRVLDDAAANQSSAEAAHTTAARAEPLGPAHSTSFVSGEPAHVPVFSTGETSAALPLQAQLRGIQELNAISTFPINSTLITIGSETTPSTLATERASTGPLQFGFAGNAGFGLGWATHAGEVVRQHERSSVIADGLILTSEQSRSGSAEKTSEPHHAAASGGVSGADSAAPRSVAASLSDADHASPSRAPTNLGTITSAASPVTAETVQPATTTAKQSDISGTDASNRGSGTTISDVATLSAKTISVLLHALVDHPVLGAEQGAVGSSSSSDLLGGTGVAKTEAMTALTASKLGTADETTTGVASTTLSTASSSTPTSSASATAVVTKAVVSTTDNGHAASATSTTALLAGDDPLKHNATTTSASSSTATKATLVGTDAASTAGQAAAPATPSVIAGDQNASSTGTSAGAADTAAMTHADALHAIAALVSATNTVSRAVSISLTTDATPLDSAQLRIIDLFLNITPDVKFRTVGNTLEIYDPAASSEATSHVAVWDVGGGALVRVIGITDGHIGS